LFFAGGVAGGGVVEGGVVGGGLGGIQGDVGSSVFALEGKLLGTDGVKVVQEDGWLRG
jgi:hypothetical protein